MGLSNDLVSQFVKVTKDEKTTKKETTVYGTVVDHNDSTYVKLDGSDILTPIIATVDVKSGERVVVLLKNHTATVTGNLTSPAVRTETVNIINDSIADTQVVADTAKQTATNFISFDSENGVMIGNRTSGSWQGVRAQIKTSEFNILDSNEKVLVTFDQFGSTNIYGNSISLISNGNVDVEAELINCRSITPSANATYTLGTSGEKGWSNIYLGAGDNKTNALHIIVGSSTYGLCGRDSNGQYFIGNNAAIMYYQAKDVNTTTTGNAFKITSGDNAASNNTTSVWFFGGADTTSRYIGSYLAYNRTHSAASNMLITESGIFGRSTSSSERYKKDIQLADVNELKELYNLPVKKFKYKDDYIAEDDELYGKDLYGFIVEDLESVIPCAVQHIKNEYGEIVPEMWNSNIIVPSMLKLIQDLNNRLSNLENKGV